MINQTPDGTPVWSSGVTLVDALSFQIEQCQAHTYELAQIYITHKDKFIKLRESAASVAKYILQKDKSEADKIEAIFPNYMEVMQRQDLCHSRLVNAAMSSILMACFSLESYINAFAIINIDEQNSDKQKFILDSFDRMRIMDKWIKLPKLFTGKSFIQGEEPFQTFVKMFEFRNEMVHNKPSPISPLKRKKFQGKIPNPNSEFHELCLEHALLAGQTHDSMIRKLHEITNIPERKFQKRYNFYVINDRVNKQLDLTIDLYNKIQAEIV